MISAGTIIAVMGGGGASTFHPEWGTPEVLADENGRLLGVPGYQALASGLRSLGLVDEFGRTLATETGAVMSAAYLVG